MSSDDRAATVPVLLLRETQLEGALALGTTSYAALGHAATIDSMTGHTVDPRILALCERVTAKRPRTVIDHILKHGHVTSEDLQMVYGYDHPPRAIRDVREQGVPLETFKLVSSRTGRAVGAYRFADPSQIKNGRIGGRQAFSKRFKEALLEKYGSKDAFTNAKLESRYLQIDHRVPYEVAGDSAFDESNLEEYMLIDASSQRSKSWSCEACINWTSLHKVENCRTCYWASPERYEHIAMKQARRLEIEFQGEAEVAVFDSITRIAAKLGTSLSDAAKKILKRGV